MNFTLEQIEAMMSMQDSLNKRLAADWALKSWNWKHAIIDECMEVHGHLGWKWWKDTSQYKVGITAENRKQVQLEVVDIWHFIMSWAIDYRYSPDEVAKELKNPTRTGNIYCEVDRLMAFAATNNIPINQFASLMHESGLTGQELYEIYVGKYALNRFRWDHGYDDGTYMKHWLVPAVSIMSHEDNWFLELILFDLRQNSIEVTAAKVELALTNYYSAVTGGK
ncbi:dUTPase [compost metagenome]